MMAKLTWLHLSDWHQKGQDFDRQVVRDALIRDIRQRSEIDPNLAQIDFVIFSGDLAFSGQSEEYEAARAYLLDPVLEATGLKAKQVFFVPGNHDMDRDIVYEMLPPELQKPLDSDVLVQKWLTEEKRRARMLEPFEEYGEFVSGYTGQATPEFASILDLQAGGKRIVLLGINSAWMCARNKDPQGEVNDYGYTLVGEPQIHAPLGQIADADLRIAVMHHPFDWLATFDRNHVEARLMQACHFILRGHEHKPQVQVISGTVGDCVVIPAGASYKRRTAEDQRYTNAYNFVHLDFDAGQGMVYLRRWSDPRNAWIEDTDAYPNGQFPIKQLPKRLGKDQPGSPPVIRLKDDLRAADAQRIEAAEKRYRELLLETCDIINLANLPEQDRHIVQKQHELKLRGLYIPLRVWVEVGAAEEATEPEREKKLWEALEKRRVAAMRGKVDEGKRGAERQRVPVGERLAQAKRLVILGDPGAGKPPLLAGLPQPICFA
jgi:predicted phosphodiesterase